MKDVKRYVVRGRTEDGAGGHFCSEVVLAYEHDDVVYDLQKLLQQSKARYEYLRCLSPQEFGVLWLENIRTGESFDSLVDKAITGQL
ncbi:hypothetical protein D3C85_517100 [compost metagenome]